MALQDLSEFIDYWDVLCVASHRVDVTVLSLAHLIASINHR